MYEFENSILTQVLIRVDIWDNLKKGVVEFEFESLFWVAKLLGSFRKTFRKEEKRFMTLSPIFLVSGASYEASYEASFESVFTD